MNALSFPRITSQFYFNDSVQCRNSRPCSQNRDRQNQIRLIFSCRRFSSQMCHSSLNCSSVSKLLDALKVFSFQAASEIHFSEKHYQTYFPGNRKGEIIGDFTSFAVLFKQICYSGSLTFWYLTLDGPKTIII